MKYAKFFIPLLIILGVVYFLFEKKEPEKEEGVVNTIGEYFLVEKDKVDKVEISEKDAKIVLVKKGSAWFLETPMNAPADTDTVNGIISAVTRNPLHRVIASEDASDLSEYGLDNPERSITLYSGSSPLLDMKLGDKNVTGSDFYAKKGAGGEILLTAVQLVDQLNYEPDYYRAKKPIQIDENKVFKLAFQYPDRSLVIEKDNETGNWYITEPQNYRARGSKVTRLLGQLKSMAIVDFLNEVFPEEESHGLSEPVVNLRLEYKINDAVETITLDLGDVHIEKNAVYARLSTMPDEDVLVEVSILSKLQLTVDDVRENSLFMIDPNEIENLDVREKGAENLTIMQTKSAEWKMITPSSGNVDRNTLKAFFEALAELRPSKFISQKDLDKMEEDTTGFTSYEVKIEIKSKGADDDYEITIGNKTRQGYYAKTNDIEGGYLIDASLVEKFLAANNTLKGAVK